MADKQGWWWPDNSKKSHYMVDNRSLCGRWGCLGNPALLEHEVPGVQCAACRKRLEKHLLAAGKKP